MKRRPTHILQKSTGLFVAIILGVVGTVLLVNSHAATPTASIQAESGTLGGSVASITDSTASSSNAVKFGTASGASTIMGWQLTAQSVGLAAKGLSCDNLPAYVSPNGNNLGVAGTTTTIYRQRITRWYDLKGNVTFDQSCIRPETGDAGNPATLSTWSNNGNGIVIFKDSDIDGTHLTTHEAAWTQGFMGVASFYRTYIHHWGSGIPIYVTDENTGADVTIENNFINDLVAEGDPGGSGNHESAFTVRDFITSMNANRKMTIRGNYFAGDGANMAGTFFTQPNDGDINNLYISNNYMTGTNGIMFYYDYDQGRFPGVTYHNIHVTNNRMSNVGVTPVYERDGAPAITEWSGNCVYNAGASNACGAAL